MVDKKISELPVSAVIEPNNAVVPAVFGGVTVQSKVKDLNQFGWEFLNDSAYTSSSPFIVNNQRTKVQINGLGILSYTAERPTAGAIWNNVSNTLTARCLGDFYYCTFLATMGFTNGINGFATFDIEVPGVGKIASQYIQRRDASLFVQELITFPIPVTLAQTVANGIEFYLDTSVSGDTLNAYDISLFVARIAAGSP